MAAKIVLITLVAILAIANGEYSYSYHVADPRTGDFKSQQEAKIGGRVEGQYSVSEPESKRTAQYSIGVSPDINGYSGLGANGNNGFAAHFSRVGFTNSLGHQGYGALGNPAYGAAGAYSHGIGGPLGGLGYAGPYGNPGFAAPFANPGYSRPLANFASGNSAWPNPASVNPLANGYASPLNYGGHGSQLSSPYCTFRARGVLGFGGRQGW